jgi:hypothetical protein
MILPSRHAVYLPCLEKELASIPGGKTVVAKDGAGLSEKGKV